MSFLETLSELPDGQVASTLTWPEAINWIRDRYLDPTGDEEQRIKRAIERHDLYRDRGAKYIDELIDKAFEDNAVRQLRKDMVDAAGYNNVTRRIVHELATLYRRPARRSVSGPSNVRYQVVQRLIRLNSVMLEVQRLAILHRAVLVGFRVQRWSQLPHLDIVEPQHFRLVTHPLEPTRLIAVILEQSLETPAMASADRKDPPAYLVWTATESFRLTKSGRLYSEPRPHTLGRIPYVLVALSPPPGALIDTSTFRDVIEAHKAVWFENTLLLKESKSATKFAVLIGDLSRAIRNQTLDSQAHVQMPDGASMTPTDLAMDLAPFRDTADHILERAAANHGIPPAILHHAGATSGYEIELRYVGIRERRIEQEPYFRAVERDLAELMSIVLKADREDLAFDLDGWSIDFGEIQMPLSAEEELRIFETKRRLGLTNTIDEIQRMNPDLEDDEEAAWERFAENVEIETKRNALMRPLQAISGSLGAETPSLPSDESERMEAAA